MERKNERVFYTLEDKRIQESIVIRMQRFNRTSKSMQKSPVQDAP